MTIHNTRLEAKVAARNRVNALANDLQKRAIAALVPFIGKKVQLATGTLSNKVCQALPECENVAHREQWFYRTSRYAVYALARVSETSKSNHPDTTLAAYADTDIFLGELADNSGVLMKLNSDPRMYRTDYTVAEIEKLRKEVRAARDAMHAAEFALAGFGEHDNS